MGWLEKRSSDTVTLTRHTTQTTMLGSPRPDWRDVPTDVDSMASPMSTRRVVVQPGQAMAASVPVPSVQGSPMMGGTWIASPQPGGAWASNVQLDAAVPSVVQSASANQEARSLVVACSTQSMAQESAANLGAIGAAPNRLHSLGQPSATAIGGTATPRAAQTNGTVGVAGSSPSAFSPWQSLNIIVPEKCQPRFGAMQIRSQIFSVPTPLRVASPSSPRTPQPQREPSNTQMSSQMRPPGSDSGNRPGAAQSGPAAGKSVAPTPAEAVACASEAARIPTGAKPHVVERESSYPRSKTTRRAPTRRSSSYEPHTRSLSLCLGHLQPCNAATSAAELSTSLLDHTTLSCKESFETSPPRSRRVSKRSSSPQAAGRGAPTGSRSSRLGSADAPRGRSGKTPSMNTTAEEAGPTDDSQLLELKVVLENSMIRTRSSRLSSPGTRRTSLASMDLRAELGGCNPHVSQREWRLSLCEQKLDDSHVEAFSIRRSLSPGGTIRKMSTPLGDGIHREGCPMHEINKTWRGSLCDAKVLETSQSDAFSLRRMGSSATARDPCPRPLEDGLHGDGCRPHEIAKEWRKSLGREECRSGAFSPRQLSPRGSIRDPCPPPLEDVAKTGCNSHEIALSWRRSLCGQKHADDRELECFSPRQIPCAGEAIRAPPPTPLADGINGDGCRPHEVERRWSRSLCVEKACNDRRSFSPRQLHERLRESIFTSSVCSEGGSQDWSARQASHERRRSFSIEDRSRRSSFLTARDSQLFHASDGGEDLIGPQKSGRRSPSRTKTGVQRSPSCSEGGCQRTPKGSCSDTAHHERTSTSRDARPDAQRSASIMRKQRSRSSAGGDTGEQFVRLVQTSLQSSAVSVFNEPLPQASSRFDPENFGDQEAAQKVESAQGHPPAPPVASSGLKGIAAGKSPRTEFASRKGNSALNTPAPQSPRSTAPMRSRSGAVVAVQCHPKLRLREATESPRVGGVRASPAVGVRRMVSAGEPRDKNVLIWAGRDS